MRTIPGSSKERSDESSPPSGQGGGQRKILGCGLAAAVALWAAPVLASELLYRPISPGFGGNPFNTDYVFGTADANNEYDEEREDRFTRDPVRDFATTLQSRLLSRISEDIVGAIFGEEAEDAGTFRVGTTVTDFARQGEVINIKIADETTGSETMIDVPVPRL